MLAIILPTFNEKENIAHLIENILNVIKKNNFKAFIIVVDDNSPDGTANAVDNLKKTYYNQIYLIKRKNKLGLGSAYIEGFKKALSLGSEYIFEMDADLSHDPREIPNFIMAAKECDLVVGSRYIQKGRIENWSMARKLISRGGTFYAKTILKIPINDLTSGYKCFKRHVLKSINLEKISSDGYSFQIELTYKAHKNNFTIKEIPIVFKDRNKGKSKFNKKIFWEAVLKVWTMKYKN